MSESREAATRPDASSRSDESPVRVMVVDDSVVVRGLLGRWLADGGLEVVGTARNGREAVEALSRLDPDVVILDIEMPEMDGLAALPLILDRRPGIQVIMASTLTRRNAEMSLKALALGASDYVPKPEGQGPIGASLDFRRDLIEKARQLGARARRRRTGPAVPKSQAALSAGPAVAPRTGAAGLRLRPFSAVPPRAVVIGSSTGGPQALCDLLRAIGPRIEALSVLVTQHMPPSFTAILAEHLAKAAGRPAREARDGEPVRPGIILVAPGGRHLRLEGRGAQVSIALDDGPPVHFCKPAVDPMFATAADVFGQACLGVVLTGMGHDGAQGAAAIAAAGGSVIAQDEATSVVWGMPGAAVQAGVCAAVLPIGHIGPKIVELIRGGRA